MPYIETSSGNAIHYRSLGEGRPLVFVHGWAMTGEIWNSQTDLAGKYRLILPDLRGHGLSSAPATGYAFRDFADDLAELFASLRLENAIVIGWSMGAQVVVQAVPCVRDRLAAAVLVSGTPRFTSSEDFPYGLPAASVTGLKLLLQRNFEKTIADFVKGMFNSEEREHLGTSAPFLHKLPVRHAAGEALDALATSDLRASLPAVDIPVLLVHGDADAICLPSASRFMKDMLPDARLELMTGAGHAPFISRSAEFNRVLSNFVDENQCI